MLHECHKYFMCRELVTKFLNLFKNFVRAFSPKYFARLSRYSWDVRGSVANLSPQNFGKFTMQNFCDARMNVVRVWYEVRATVLRKKMPTPEFSITPIWAYFYACFSFRTPKIHCHGFSLTPCFFLVTRPKLSINYVKK